MGRDKNLTVESTWEGGYRCTVAARQFRIKIDEPESEQTTLKSLSACLGADGSEAAPHRVISRVPQCTQNTDISRRARAWAASEQFAMCFRSLTTRPHWGQ